ncbi:MAG: Usg family protein [Alphaproteobacteria bacterium]|nr:Usg family protein [Alphaproteobacteria bacterium]
MTPKVDDLFRYRLTTAEIFYRFPDYPGLLQTYLWQEMDVVPDFPRLTRFLDYWERNLEGKLHTVRIANAELVRPQEIAYAGNEFRLH